MTPALLLVLALADPPAEDPGLRAERLRAECAQKKVTSCISLAHLLSASRPPLVDAAGAQAAIQAAGELEIAACEQGRPGACAWVSKHAEAEDDRREFGRRMDALCTRACEGHDADWCAALADTGFGPWFAYPWRPTDSGEPDSARCRKAVADQEVSLREAACAQGVAEDCRLLGRLRDARGETNQARAAHSRATALGSKAAKRDLAALRARERPHVTLALGAGWGYADGWNGSFSLLVGKADLVGCSDCMFDLPDARGLLIELEGAQRGARLGLGWGAAAGTGNGSLALVIGGFAAKAVVLRSWSDGHGLQRDHTYVGAEAQMTLFLRVRVSMVADTRGGGAVFSAGVGLGF